MKLAEFISSERYTWQHKLAFLRTERELLGHNTLNGYMHDADKLLFLYPIAFISGRDKKWASDIHRCHSRHHVENNLKKTRRNYMEMLIDWESARFTKPDKPLTAYQTMKQLYPSMEPHLLPLMREFGLIR